jgi:hypothetical protein
MSDRSRNRSRKRAGARQEPIPILLRLLCESKKRQTTRLEFFWEAAMARIVVRCQYTGHYIFTGIDTSQAPIVVGGRIYCPYCAADHVWTSFEARLDQPASGPLVRQAS